MGATALMKEVLLGAGLRTALPVLFVFEVKDGISQPPCLLLAAVSPHCHAGLLATKTTGQNNTSPSSLVLGHSVLSQKHKITNTVG